MAAITGWLLTYLLHSSVLLAAAALVRLALRDRRLAFQEAVLRAALLGGFVTTSLQLGYGVQPLGGSLALPRQAPAIAVGEVVALQAAAPRIPDPRPDVVPAPAAVEAAGAEPRLAARAWSAWPEWRSLLLAAWCLLALGAAAHLAVAHARLRRLLRDRRPLADGALTRGAAGVASTLGLRPVPLSTAPGLVVPLATGVRRPEVCLPARALAELSCDEQVALCAHELAHVARRDPAWILLARLIEAAAPMQPLNLWAGRRLRDLAECLSDDLAVAASGRPVGLARSLVGVASWTVGDAFLTPALAAGAFAPRSRLGHRVERLMDPLRNLERPRRLLLPLAGAAVIASALVTPVISGRQGPEAPPPPDAVEEPAAPAELEAPAEPEAPVEPQAGLDPADPGTEVAPVAPVPAVAPVPPVPPVAAAPVAPEAPEAPPNPPAREAQPAPPAKEGVSPKAERELERLSERIHERAQRHQEEMAGVQAEAEALASQLRPHEEQMQRLGHELARAAREMAHAMADAHESAGAGRAEKAARARANFDELRHQMQELAKSVRPPEAELRAIGEKARALAQAARPTEEELREVRRLRHVIVREAMPDPEEIRRVVEHAAGRVREGRRRAAEELRRVGDELRKVTEELRRAKEELRRVKEETARAGERR